MVAGKDSAGECVGDSGQKKRPNITHLAIARPPPLLRQRGKGGGWEEGGRKMNAKKVERGKAPFRSRFYKSYMSFLLIFRPHTLFFPQGEASM